MAVKAICVSWDLAISQIVAAKSGFKLEETGVNQLPFLSVGISDALPAENPPLVCVDKPGGKDLEASQPDLATNYDVLHVSTDRFCGYSE